MEFTTDKFRSNSNIMGKLKRNTIVVSIITAMIVILFLSAIAYTRPPPDYLPDRIESRYLESGGAKMYGYTFVSWDKLMNSNHSAEYIDLVAQGLDFAFVHTQWSVVGKEGNDSLDLNYLGNLTNYIKALRAKGVQVVIHIWVSSYSPAWLYPLVPELVGQPDRWAGIDPNTTNQTALEHRQILKNSMIYYVQRLCNYFNSSGLISDIRGWCLDDETSSEYWADFFRDITKVLLSYNASWRIGAMFNRYDKYHLTGETGMTTNYMDPYDSDYRFVQKITYAYQVSGVNNISVLIDAMGPHDDEGSNNMMRREAWIAWFMGADSIGWYTYLYPTDKWACVKWNDGNGPITSAKTQTAINAKSDVHLLNNVYSKIYNTNNTTLKSEWTNDLLSAYRLAKINQFDDAVAILNQIMEA